MKRKHLLFVGAIITIIALIGFGKTDAKADQEMVTEWYSEPHPEYFVFADCVEETSGGENATHYVYERYLWHDGKTWRATSKRLVPSDYTLNKYITSRDYGGVGKNTKKYNLWLSKEYDYPVQEESGGGYNVVSVTGEEFHAWSFYTVSSGSAPTQYRYRFSRTHNEYITNLNGYYRITTVPGKSFDVAGWGTESGTNLIIWDDIPPQANQTFFFSLQSDGSYIISDQNSGLCIDVDGDTVNGTNICMKTYTGGTSQRWYIGANSDGTYSLVSALFKVFVADIENGTDGLAGSNVHLWQWHGGQNQRFYLEKVDDKDEIVSKLLNMSDGFELKNKNSGRMLNLYHGKTKDGSKFDTYPRDYTDTQLFWIISSDKGVQLKNACSSNKRVDVKTNGSGTPKEGDAVCLYAPTSDDCSYWKINYIGQDDSGIYVNIESAKTPGLYIGHPSKDLKGEKRNGLVLCTDGIADRCLWYVYERNNNGIDVDVDVDKAMRSVLDEIVTKLEGKLFTYSGEECPECKGKEFVGGHACWNCSATHIVDGTCSWYNDLFDEFKNINVGHFPSIAMLTRENPTKKDRDYSGQSCFGFGAWAQWYIYSKVFGERNLKGRPYFATGLFNYEFFNSIGARAGDVIRRGGHTMVIYSYDKNSITVVDCNANVDNTVVNCVVRKRTIKYNSAECALSRPEDPKG